MSVFGTSAHRCFVDCKVDARCFAERPEVLGETYAKQVLNEKSDISGTDEVMKFFKIAVQGLGVLRAG